MDGARSLASLVASRADGDGIVAFERAASGEEQATNRAEWRASVLELASRLESAQVGAGSRVALYDEDPLEFSVGLFALWARGAVAVLPPNAQPGTLERLRASVEASVGCDVGLGERATFRARLRGSEIPQATAQAGELDRSAPALELFTSGTTGEGKPSTKELRHLDDEVQALERAFGARLGSARVYATASHQHLYGLLFRVLWPLASGRPFCRDRLLHAEELLPRLAAEGPSALASVPAHLDRMRAAAGFEKLARQAAGACVVFSSGGPLSSETAHGWEDMLGDAPTEVFGSTETGGVAHRRQQRVLGSDVAWTAFEGVDVALDEAGCLQVTSAVASEGRAVGDRRVFSMGDRAEFDADGQFRLRGRADRVVKIGEKRVSLPDMESRLRAHDGVSKAALVAVALAGQERVGAVVVPSRDGTRRLSSDGRAAFGRELAEHLARDFDRVLVPRVWRYVEALPEDAQGKTTAAALRALFDADASNEAGAPSGERLREPPCTASQSGQDGDTRWLERSLFVSPELDALDGHFPNAPIVPGVAQIAWAVSAATELLGFDAHPERIEALKFTSALEPGIDVVLRVERRVANADSDESPARVQFRITRAGDRQPVAGERDEISTGRLYLVRRASHSASERTDSGGRGVRA